MTDTNYRTPIKVKCSSFHIVLLHNTTRHLHQISPPAMGHFFQLFTSQHVFKSHETYQTIWKYCLLLDMGGSNFNIVSKAAWIGLKYLVLPLLDLITLDLSWPLSANIKKTRSSRPYRPFLLAPVEGLGAFCPCVGPLAPKCRLWSYRGQLGKN